MTRGFAVTLGMLASVAALVWGVMALYRIPFPGTHPQPIEVLSSYWAHPRLRGPHQHDTRWVVGQLRNNTDAPFHDVTLEIVLENRHGDSTGVTLDSVGTLAPHEVKYFGSEDLPGSTPRYRIRSVRGH